MRRGRRGIPGGAPAPAAAPAPAHYKPVQPRREPRSRQQRLHVTGCITEHLRRQPRVMHSRTTPHRWSERMQWHQPRAAVPAKSWRERRAAWISATGKCECGARTHHPSVRRRIQHDSTSQAHCSKNVPLLRCTTALMASAPQSRSLNVSSEPRSLKWH